MYLLLRLEHVLEKDEDSTLSKPVIVDLQGLFSPFEITSLRETTLGANKWLNEIEPLSFTKGDNLEYFVDDGDCDMQKWLEWKAYHNDLHRSRVPKETKSEDQYKILLNPMQIRSFVIDVKKKDTF